jgi:hypothetical protein
MFRTWEFCWICVLWLIAVSVNWFLHLFFSKKTFLIFVKSSLSTFSFMILKDKIIINVKILIDFYNNFSIEQPSEPSHVPQVLVLQCRLEAFIARKWKQGTEERTEGQRQLIGLSLCLPQLNTIWTRGHMLMTQAWLPWLVETQVRFSITFELNQVVVQYIRNQIHKYPQVKFWFNNGLCLWLLWC